LLVAHLDQQPATDAGSDLRARIQERVEQRRRAGVLSHGHQPDGHGADGYQSDGRGPDGHRQGGQLSMSRSAGSADGSNAAGAEPSPADSQRYSRTGRHAVASGTVLTDRAEQSLPAEPTDHAQPAEQDERAEQDRLAQQARPAEQDRPVGQNGRATAIRPADLARLVDRRVTPLDSPASAPAGRRRHAAVPAGPGLLQRAARWLVLLVVTAIAVFGLRQYVIASYYIPSASMETTLHGCPGCQPDMVLVDKLSYRFKSINRRDVVVFTRPPQAPPEDKQLIKRVIGLPGEVVSGHDGHVFVDNKELVEPYVDPACHGTAAFGPVRVPADRYFVMGDNRCDSFDSRMFGTIPRSSVIGRAFAVIWPVHHLRWL
jgi:signal peptidase I